MPTIKGKFPLGKWDLAFVCLFFIVVYLSFSITPKKTKHEFTNQEDLIVDWQDNQIVLYYRTDDSYKNINNQVSLEHLQYLVQIHSNHLRQVSPNLDKKKLIDAAKHYIVRINHLRYDLVNNLTILKQELDLNDEKLLEFKKWIEVYNLFYYVGELEKLNQIQDSKELHRQIALLYDIRDIHDKALEYFGKVFEDIEFIVFLDQKAKDAAKKRQLTKAIIYYKKALSIARRVKGEKDPAYASILANTAQTLVFAKRYQEAYPLLQEAISIYKNTLAPDNTRLIAQQLALASLYGKLNQPEKTIELLERGLLKAVENTQLYGQAMKILFAAKHQLNTKVAL